MTLACGKSWLSQFSARVPHPNFDSILIMSRNREIGLFVAAGALSAVSHGTAASEAKAPASSRTSLTSPPHRTAPRPAQLRAAPRVCVCTAPVSSLPLTARPTAPLPSLLAKRPPAGRPLSVSLARVQASPASPASLAGGPGGRGRESAAATPPARDQVMPGQC